MAKFLTYNYINKVETALFWRCYAIEQKIRHLSRILYRHLILSVVYSNIVLITVLGGIPQVTYAPNSQVKALPVLPTVQTRLPQTAKKVVVTFYSSTPDQTDSTPFITASGTQVRFGIVAANFLPFGTRLRLPELFEDQIFVVHDRMNLRYSNRIDVWLESRDQALEKGVHYTLAEIY